MIINFDITVVNAAKHQKDISILFKEPALGPPDPFNIIQPYFLRSTVPPKAEVKFSFPNEVYAVVGRSDNKPRSSIAEGNTIQMQFSKKPVATGSCFPVFVKHRDTDASESIYMGDESMKPEILPGGIRFETGDFEQLMGDNAYFAGMARKNSLGFLVPVDITAIGPNENYYFAGERFYCRADSAGALGSRYATIDFSEGRATSARVTYQQNGTYKVEIIS